LGQGKLGPHLTQCKTVSPNRANRCKTVRPMTANRFTNDRPKMGRKFWRWLCAPPPWGGEELGPHFTQSRLGWGLPPCQVPSWSIQPFGYNKHGFIFWGGAPPPFSESGGGSLSNTKSPGPRPTSIPSGILIHASIWSQQILAENWGLCPFGEGELGPHLTECGQGRGLPACQDAKFHLDSSNRLATYTNNVRDRHDRSDRTTDQ